MNPEERYSSFVLGPFVKLKEGNSVETEWVCSEYYISQREKVGLMMKQEKQNKILWRAQRFQSCVVRTC